jgi:hypothetical protein
MKKNLFLGPLVYLGYVFWEEAPFHALLFFLSGMLFDFMILGFSYVLPRQKTIDALPLTERDLLQDLLFVPSFYAFLVQEGQIKGTPRDFVLAHQYGLVKRSFWSGWTWSVSGQVWRQKLKEETGA